MGRALVDGLEPVEWIGVAVLAVLSVLAAVWADRRYGHGAAGAGALGLVAASAVAVWLRNINEAAAVALAAAIGQTALGRFRQSTEPEPEPEPELQVEPEPELQVEPGETDGPPAEGPAGVVDHRPESTAWIDRSAYPTAPEDPEP